MKLIDAWQDAAIREGFELGQSLRQVAAETGLSAVEVFRRQLDLGAEHRGCKSAIQYDE